MYRFQFVTTSIDALVGRTHRGMVVTIVVVVLKEVSRHSPGDALIWKCHCTRQSVSPSKADFSFQGRLRLSD